MSSTHSFLLSAVKVSHFVRGSKKGIVEFPLNAVWDLSKKSVLSKKFDYELLKKTMFNYLIGEEIRRSIALGEYESVTSLQEFLKLDPQELYPKLEDAVAKAKTKFKGANLHNMISYDLFFYGVYDFHVSSILNVIEGMSKVKRNNFIRMMETDDPDFNLPAFWWLSKIFKLREKYRKQYPVIDADGWIACAKTANAL